MRIMIEMSDNDYERIKDMPDAFDSLTSRAYGAIKNGIPLSKEFCIHVSRLVEDYKIKKEQKEEKYKPESCDKCMHHLVIGLFDQCGLDNGKLLMDENTDYTKQRDPKCPLN